MNQVVPPFFFFANLPTKEPPAFVLVVYLVGSVQNLVPPAARVAQEASTNQKVKRACASTVRCATLVLCNNVVMRRRGSAQRRSPAHRVSTTQIEAPLTAAAASLALVATCPKQSTASLATSAMLAGTSPTRCKTSALIAMR